MSGFRVCKRDQGFIGPGEHRKLRVEFPSLLVPEHPGFALMKPRPCGPDQDTLLLAGRAALGVMGLRLPAAELGNALPSGRTVSGGEGLWAFPIKLFPLKQKPLRKVILLLSAYELGLPWWLSYKRTHLPVKETAASTPGLGSSLEEETATHSGFLIRRMPWTEQPGLLQRAIGS